MINKIKHRVFISFDGSCPYKCKHCYTFELPESNQQRSIMQIVNSIENKTFDIVYVSQKRENYIDPIEGIRLCEEIFKKYNCNIMTITRNILNAEQKERFISLHNKMRIQGKSLFLGISVIGLASSKRSEDFEIIPTPEKRIEFAKEMYSLGINTLLLIRPLFPQKIIPLSELEQIIDLIKGNISCVLSGALMANKHIMNRLNLNEDDLAFLAGGESEYLDGAISDSMQFVDISHEMLHLKNYCLDSNVPFFEHSMPALNYLIEKNHSVKYAI